MPKGFERPDPHAGRTVDRLQPQSSRRSQNHTIRAHYQSRLRRLSYFAQNACPLSRYLRDHLHAVRSDAALSRRTKAMQSRSGSRSLVIDLVSVSEARALVLDEEPTQQGHDGIFPIMRIIIGPP